MTTLSLLPNAKQQFLSPNNVPLAGGTVETYIPGTSTLVDTYRTSTGGGKNTHPITLDAFGSCIIWASGMIRQVVKDASGNLIWDQVTEGAPIGPVFFPVEAFGGSGNNSTDNTAAIQAAAAQGIVVFTSGTYYIASSLVVIARCLFLPGASVRLVTGQTLTLSGGLFDPPVAQIFKNALAGQGTVVFNFATQDEGVAEWWGATTNVSGADCLAAMLAAHAALKLVQLQAADYYISATLKLQTNFRIVQGYLKHWGAVGDSTRIIVKSATLDAVQIGLDSFPGGGINACATEITLRNLSVTRSTTVTGNATLKTCPAGVRVQFALYADVENVWSTENSLGFIFSGAINSRLTKGYAFRSVSGTDAAHDPFLGIFYDGSASIGAAGGNASIYINGCNATVGGAPTLTLSAGYYGYQGSADCFIDGLETQGLDYGLFASASGGTTTCMQDFVISNCVFDQCNKYGLNVADIGALGTVNVLNVYVAASSSGSFSAGFQFSNFNGLASVSGGQFLGDNSAVAIGLYISTSSGITVDGLLIREAITPVGFNASTNCRITVAIRNATNVATNGAVHLGGTCARNELYPLVMGVANKFSHGIKIDAAGSGYNLADCSGIDAACINGGSANKLLYNATQIVAAGVFGTTNLAQGIMA